MEGDIDFVSVDCSAEAELCSRDQVFSFPAIRLRQLNGGQIRYRGARKASSIQGFLRRTSRPKVSYVTEQNRTAFESIDDFVFVGRLPSGERTLQREFEAVAGIYRDRYSFAMTGAHRTPELSCYNNLDGLQATTTVLDTPASFESFIALCAKPLIPQMTRRNELSFYSVSTANKIPNSAPLTYVGVLDPEEHCPLLRAQREEGRIRDRNAATCEEIQRLSTLRHDRRRRVRRCG